MRNRLLHRVMAATIASSFVAFGIADRIGTASAPKREKLRLLHQSRPDPRNLFYKYDPPSEDTGTPDAKGAAASNFSVTYDAGFLGNASARAALQNALNIWGNVIASPVTIKISADFFNFGPGFLAQASATGFCFHNGYYRHNALHDKLTGSDSCYPGQAELFIQMNSYYPWDFGSTPVAGKYNFMTVALHELGHGLGFSGSMYVDGAGSGSYWDPSLIYDAYAVTGGGTYLVDFPNPSQSLGSWLVSNDVWFAGPNTVAQNSGFWAQLKTSLYPFDDRSSYHHLEDDRYDASPNGLMTSDTAMAEVYADPGPIVRGMFLDLGWSLAPKATMTSAGLTANKTAPQTPGTTITFTASGTGGQTPYEYKFLLTTNNWTNYTILRDWSPLATYAWTPNSVNASYQIGVWARSAGNPANTPEAAAAMAFPIAQAVVPVMTSVSISANKVSPQAPNTTTTFTATGAGGAAPYSYKFFVTANNWATWSVLRDWSTVNTAAWTPSAGGSYQVGVWARSSGNSADAPEQSAGMPFSINFLLSISVIGNGSVTTNVGGIQCPSVTCSQSYAPGTSVTFTATPVSNNVYSGSWYPDCATGTVVMNADRTCFLEFLPASATGTKRGTVNLDGSRFGDAFAYDPKTGSWTMENGEASFFFNDIKGTWSAGWDVYSADFNNDLFTDFFLYNPQNGQWYKVINNGNGTFTYFFGQWSAGWQIFIVDLNGDHRSDVFLHNPASGTWYWSVSTGNGTSGFAYTAGQWSAGWQVYPADLNADGWSDLFLYNSTLGWQYQVINNKAGGFQYTFGQWSAGWSIVPADFNGDSKTDFFLSSAATGQWYVALTGNLNFTYGTGTWSLGWTFSPGDFNGDGKADLLLHNPANGWFYQAVSNGAGAFALTFGSWTVGLRPYVADFTDDGKSDVLLYNPTTGLAFKAVNNGLGSFSMGSHTWDKGLTLIVGTPYP